MDENWTDLSNHLKTIGILKRTTHKRNLAQVLRIQRKKGGHYKMQATNSVQIFKKIHNVVEKDLDNDSMFFFKGAVIGGIISLFLWVLIFWVIT
jgi:hypothetical protein